MCVRICLRVCLVHECVHDVRSARVHACNVRMYRQTCLAHACRRAPRASSATRLCMATCCARLHRHASGSVMPCAQRTIAEPWCRPNNLRCSKMPPHVCACVYERGCVRVRLSVCACARSCACARACACVRAGGRAPVRVRVRVCVHAPRGDKSLEARWESTLQWAGSHGKCGGQRHVLQVQHYSVVKHTRLLHSLPAHGWTIYSMIVSGCVALRCFDWFRKPRESRCRRTPRPVPG